MRPLFWKKKSPPPAQAVIFDLDNTLEDFATAEAIAEATLAKLVATQTGCKPMEFLGAFTHAKARHSHKPEPHAYSRLIWIEDVARSRSLKLDAQELEATYWDVLRKNVRLYPDAITTLRALKAKGLKLALLSDSDGIKGFKRKRIDELKLTLFFDAIVTSDDVGENKPSMKGFREVMRLLDIPASACVMVGDHPEFDLAPAKRIGMRTVWNQERIVIDRTWPFVDYKIKKVEDLLTLPLF